MQLYLTGYRTIYDNSLVKKTISF